VQALDQFIADIYDRQQIIRDGIFPREVLAQSANSRAECVGIKPRFGVWAHICGSDLVRDARDPMYVLEDNLRVPSDVSYMLENRLVMKRIFPELFADHQIFPVDDFSSRLFSLLASLSPRPGDDSNIVVLSSGIYNSAYFEHSYLAQQMVAELVTGKDLLVENDVVYMKTIAGRVRVDVIYRRIDDQFLDTLYCLWAVGILGGYINTVGDTIELERAMRGVGATPKAGKISDSTFAAYSFAIVQAIGNIVSLIFMWSVRHPKSE
jgi:uncharacterized circularly permuted ATP-grasp superfamily protein